MLNTLNFMSVRERIEYNVIVFIYKILNVQRGGREVRERRGLWARREGMRTRQANHIRVDFRRRAVG